MNPRTSPPRGLGTKGYKRSENEHLTKGSHSIVMKTTGGVPCGACRSHLDIRGQIGCRDGNSLEARRCHNFPLGLMKIANHTDHIRAWGSLWIPGSIRHTWLGIHGISPKHTPPTHPHTHTHTREKNWNPRNQRSRIYAHGWPQRWSGRKPVDPYRSPPSRHGRHLTPALVSLDTSGFSTAQRDLACAMTINCQRNASCMFKPAPSQSKTTEVESPVGMFQAC